MRYRRRTWMPLLTVLAMLAAACGAEEASTEPEPAATTVPAAQPEPTTTTRPEAETEELHQGGIQLCRQFAPLMADLDCDDLGAHLID